MDRRSFIATLGVLAARPLFASAVRSQGQTFVHPPYLQNVRAGGITVMWSIVEFGTGEVEYYSNDVTVGRVTARSRRFDPVATKLDTPFFQYAADITGLQPNTEYSYKIIMNGQLAFADSSLRFVTNGPGDVTFLVLGDSGEGTLEQSKLADCMALERPSFLLHVGDIAYPDGSFEAFTKNYFDFYPLMGRAPFFPTPGNHEYQTDNAAPYLALHCFPDANVPAEDRGRYYSFDWSNIHFVSLDSNLSLERDFMPSGRMLGWLENDLKSTRQFWKVAFFHHPPFAFGPNSTDPRCAMGRDYVVPILERYGVQVVFSGHEHSYQRAVPMLNGRPTQDGLGIMYFTCGGGGGPLYPVFQNPLLQTGLSDHHYMRVAVSGIQMKISAIRQDGSEIESCLIAPPPAVINSGIGSFLPAPPSTDTGAQVHIVGKNLAPIEIYPPAITPFLPDMGTQVVVNGIAIPLFYVSPTEIYGYLANPVNGSVNVGIRTSNGSTETSIPIRGF